MVKINENYRLGIGTIQEIFSIETKIAIADPVYGVSFGSCGENFLRLP